MASRDAVKKYPKPTNRVQRKEACGICMAGQHTMCVREIDDRRGNMLICGCLVCYPELKVDKKKSVVVE